MTSDMNLRAHFINLPDDLYVWKFRFDQTAILSASCPANPPLPHKKPAPSSRPTRGCS